MCVYEHRVQKRYIVCICLPIFMFIYVIVTCLIRCTIYLQMLYVYLFNTYVWYSLSIQVIVLKNVYKRDITALIVNKCIIHTCGCYRCYVIIDQVWDVTTVPCRCSFTHLELLAQLFTK
mgnify:CR=1 FL=1